MSTKYTVRVASNVAYEYWEATSDSYQEMLSAEQELRELKAESGVENAKQQLGGREVEAPKTSGFGQKKASGGGFGNKGRQQSAGEDRFLGKHDGYSINVKNGKYGYYFNAYQKGADPERINANLADGQDPASVSLEDAIAALSEA